MLYYNIFEYFVFFQSNFSHAWACPKISYMMVLSPNFKLNRFVAPNNRNRAQTFHNKLHVCNFNNFWPKFPRSEMGVAKSGQGLAFQILPLNDFGSLMVLRQLPMANNSGLLLE